MDQVLIQYNGEESDLEEMIVTAARHNLHVDAASTARLEDGKTVYPLKILLNDDWVEIPFGTKIMRGDDGVYLG